MSRENGYTLLELVVVVGVIAIISALAVPSLVEWRQNAAYRQTARDLYAAFLQARSYAISDNREYRVAVDLDGDLYRIERGDRSAGSTDGGWTAVAPWTGVNREANLTGNADCSVETGTIFFHFNPNGTSTTRYLCIEEAKAPGELRGQVAVQNSNTGIPKLGIPSL